MNEQLKDFLKKASEDESIKDELKALEGLSAEENAEQRQKKLQKSSPIRNWMQPEEGQGSLLTA